MIRVSACARLLVALLATGSMADARASDLQEQRNGDGSRLRLQLVDLPDPDDAGFVRVLVDYAAPGSEDFVRRLDLVADAEGEPLRGANLFDIDQDGFHEVEVRGLCGAGPNCIGELYRLDPASGTLRLFFSGGYADLWVMDGHLVEAGRASCCSWEFHAWRLDGRPEVLDMGNMDLLASVGLAPDAVDDTAPLACAFERRDGQRWTPVAPPNEAWLRLCAWYDAPYHVVLPDQAPGAGPSQEP